MFLLKVNKSPFVGFSGKADVNLTESHSLRLIKLNFYSDSVFKCRDSHQMEIKSLLGSSTCAESHRENRRCLKCNHRGQNKSGTRINLHFHAKCEK